MSPRIDEQITASRVLVVDAHGKVIGEHSREHAIELAHNIGMHLVEVQPNTTPPVCKFMHADRVAEFVNQRGKRSGEAREVRSLTFRTNMREADVLLRLRHALAHLRNGGIIEIRVEQRSKHDHEARALVDQVISALHEFEFSQDELRVTECEIIALVRPQSGS